MTLSNAKLAGEGSELVRTDETVLLPMESYKFSIVCDFAFHG